MSTTNRSDNNDTASHRVGSNNLPTYLSSFVGREKELIALETLAGKEDVRLLTLTGPGGSGKTRLAAQLAMALNDTFEDGVCWVELESISDPELISQSVVMAMELDQTAGTPPLKLLEDVLQSRQMMLVVDNCEHLLEACSRLLEKLLVAAADLKIIATSRERLHIDGEVIWNVPGLSLPGEIPAFDNELNGHSLLDYDALRLFTERATALLPDLELNSRSMEKIAQICRHVDGLPMAVELAAVRVQTLGLDQIARQMSEHIDLLAQGSRSAPVRQQTLRATLDWSYQLLTDQERVLLRRLSVFQGSFSLDAAKEVASGEMVLADIDDTDLLINSHDIHNSITGLVNKSLVVVERPWEGWSSYRLLNIIREFAKEILVQVNDCHWIHDAHLRYYHRLAGSAERGLKGPEQREWVQKLQLEHDNLRAALGWAIAQAEDSQALSYNEIALQMGAHLFWFWNAANHFAEGRNWLEQCLGLRAKPGSESLRAQALHSCGTMDWLMGDFGPARTRLEECLALYHQLEDPFGIANARMMLGRVHLYKGEADPAVRLLEQSAAAFQDLDRSFERGLALGGLSASLAMRGDHDDARSNAEEMLSIFRAIGDPFFTSLALGDLGWAAYHQGDLTTAVVNLEESLILRRQIESSWMAAQALSYLGEIYRFQRRFDAATQLVEESLALAEDTGARAWIASGTRQLGLVSLRLGKGEEAAGLLKDSLEHCFDLGDLAGAAMALEGLAAAAVDNQSSELAWTFFGAAERVRETAGPPRTLAEKDDLASLVNHLSSMEGKFQVNARGLGYGLTNSHIIEKASQFSLSFRSTWIEITPTPHVLRIYALGPTQVFLRNRPLAPSDWSYAKPRELLFYLVANPQRTKEKIGLDFWPDASSSQLRRNFRAALYHLRQALGQRGWVLYEDGRYAFNRTLDYWYDVEHFEGLLTQALSLKIKEPERALKILDDLPSIYRGEFLGDIKSDDWSMLKREELQQAYIESQLVRGQLYAERQDYPESAQILKRVLEIDNLIESAHRDLMRVYACSGRPGQALRHYQSLLQLLNEELGVSPAPETVSLAELIKAQKPL